MNAAPIADANLSGIISNSAGGYSVQVVDLDGCIGMSAVYGILPIDKVSLKGTLSKRDVLLKWDINNDVNTEEYEIQKSIDGQNFVKIGVVKSIKVGYSYQYSFTDKNISDFINYYRIKIKSSAGEIRLSNVIVIKLNDISEVSIVPNPVIDILNLKINSNIDQKIKFILYSSEGKRISTGNYSVRIGQNLFSMNINNISSGVYYIDIFTLSSKRRLHFIKD